MTVLLALIVVLTISWLIQAALTFAYAVVLRGWQVPLIDDQAAPPAVAILCLRGGDPFLHQCIDGLLTQDYPGYRVRFVVDSEHDPALAVVHASVARHCFDRFEILILAEPLPTCSLKCSSLAQAISDLVADDSGRQDNSFVALLDADTIPHGTWLRELATGLQSPNVGAATGNRWYMPETVSLGAMTRHIWNAAAIVQMYFYRIAWGGTLAIKLDSIRRADLLAWWTQAMCEDTMTQSRLASIGQQLRFVPSLMMVNREDVSLSRLVPWMRRQLLTTRLYHPYWYLVLLHGVASAGQLLWGWGMCVFCLLHGQWWLAGASGLAMLVYQAALNSLLPWIASPVEAIVRARGEDTTWRRNLTTLGLLRAIVVTQWVYTWALLSCIFVRKVEWRGIDYLINGPWDVRMLGYKPYGPASREEIQSL